MMVAMTETGTITGFPAPRDGNSDSRYGGCDAGKCMHSGLLHVDGVCVVRGCQHAPSDPVDLAVARELIGLGAA